MAPSLLASYVGTSTGFAAVAADGKQKWLSPTGKSYGGAIGADGTIYYVSMIDISDYELYAIGP